MRDLVARFNSRVDKNGPVPAERPDLGPCWQWLGALNNSGYGFFQIADRKLTAQRAAYIVFVGEIPDGYVIDHLCRNRACGNPAHMEAVPNAVNLIRGEGPDALRRRSAALTHCKHGHEFTATNTYVNPSTGRRQCRTCVRTVYGSTRRKARA